MRWERLCTELLPCCSCVSRLRSGITKSGAGIARTASDCESPPDVPTLFRFLAFIAIIAGLIFGGMIALVTFVEPMQREMIEIVPPSRLQPK